MEKLMSKQNKSFQKKKQDLRYSFGANSEIERLRRVQRSEMEGVQASWRVQSVEQEMKRFEQELK